MTLPPPLSPHDVATAEAQALHAMDDGYYGQFEIAKLRASPDNRKRFKEQALQELAASIKSMGVAQPILIRPVTPTAEEPAIFEIVAGERRFRASKIAGMATIPAMCRTLSNLDAAKIRILENLQREDPHPIEEAEGYQQLMLQHGYSADQLAEEIKKSRAYIYGRLKLCALTTEVREHFLEDKIPASTALLIARIPVPALQAKVLGEILNPPAWQGPGPLSYRKAVEHVQERYMLDLTTAIFKLSDGKLLAAAGSCVKCPKRAGNQPEIFTGVSADVCTDPDCFAEKKAAHHTSTAAMANKKGIPVYEGEDANALHNKKWNMDSELVTGDLHLTRFLRNAPSTKNEGYVHKYLNADALENIGAAAYTKAANGELTPYYRRDAIQQALEAHGICETVEQHAQRMSEIAADPNKAPPQNEHAVRWAKEERERQEAMAGAERESSYRVALYKKLRQRAGIEGLGLSSLREYTKAVLAEHDLVSSLHDLYEHDVSTDLDSFIDKADSGTLQLLLIDAFLGSMLRVDWYHFKNGNAGDDGFETIEAMCRHESLDPDQVREELFPSPIDVDNMQQGDLVAFIGKYPQRLAELKDAVLTHPRGELVGMLEKAANEHGYVYGPEGFALKADEQPAVAPAQPEPEQAPEPQAEPADVGDDLAQQLEEVEAATRAPTKPAAKSAKPKPGGSKAGNKAKAKKPHQAKKLSAAEAWPFPKSSTQLRERTPALAPAEEAVNA